MHAFFIDADNLCVSAWVEEAFKQLERESGAIAVRRAYGSAEKLKGLSEVLQARHIRPFVNAALSKNTTDVALAVDVMEMSCQTPRLDMIVIGSGDADFVPLVLRLRERGFRMVCVSAHGKMATEAIDAYERVILVGEAAPTMVAAISAPALVPAIQLVSAPPPPAKKVVAKKAPTKKAAAKKAPAKKAPAKKAKPETAKAAEVGKVTVEQILQKVSALRSGEPLPLNDVAKLLHDGKLLGKNSSSPKLFKKFPHHFELLPSSKQPQQVRFIPVP